MKKINQKYNSIDKKENSRKNNQITISAFYSYKF